MKTFLIYKPLLRKCESTLSDLPFLLWQLPWQGVQYGLAQIKTRFFIPLMIVRAFRALHAGIVALILSSTANKRILCGLGLMLAGAPLVYFTYAIFDREHLVPGWYHHNYWHLFFLIRYQLAQIVFLIGLYIALPKTPITKFIAPYLGFVMMGIAINVMADSNDDIWDTLNVTLWAAGVVLSLTLFFLIDWLAHRKFHRVDAFEARLEGIFQISEDMPLDKIGSMFLTTWKAKKEFNSKQS